MRFYESFNLYFTGYYPIMTRTNSSCTIHDEYSYKRFNTFWREVGMQPHTISSTTGLYNSYALLLSSGCRYETLLSSYREPITLSGYHIDCTIGFRYKFINADSTSKFLLQINESDFTAESTFGSAQTPYFRSNLYKNQFQTYYFYEGVFDNFSGYQQYALSSNNDQWYYIEFVIGESESLVGANPYGHKSFILKRDNQHIYTSGGMSNAQFHTLPLEVNISFDGSGALALTDIYCLNHAFALDDPNGDPSGSFLPNAYKTSSILLRPVQDTQITWNSTHEKHYNAIDLFGTGLVFTTGILYPEVYTFSGYYSSDYSNCLIKGIISCPWFQNTTPFAWRRAWINPTGISHITNSYTYPFYEDFVRPHPTYTYDNILVSPSSYDYGYFINQYNPNTSGTWTYEDLSNIQLGVTTRNTDLE